MGGTPVPLGHWGCSILSMLRAAVLQHDLPDGSSHLDLLIESTAGRDPDERVLLTFRVAREMDAAALLSIVHADGAGGFDAERADDHRRLYLDYEGSIPGGRGAVVRLARGFVSEISHDEARCGATIDFGAGPITMAGERVGTGSAWRFEVGAERRSGG